MGKVSVRKCDACGVLDSDDNRVKRVAVAGPRFDLCATDRVAALVTAGSDADDAVRYVAETDGYAVTDDPNQLLLVPERPGLANGRQVAAEGEPEAVAAGG